MEQVRFTSGARVSGYTELFCRSTFADLSAGSPTASQCDGPQFASDRIPASALQREDPGAPKNAAHGQNFFGVEK